jgi:hypothetical protein
VIQAKRTLRTDPRHRAEQNDLILHMFTGRKPTITDRKLNLEDMKNDQVKESIFNTICEPHVAN